MKISGPKGPGPAKPPDEPAPAETRGPAFREVLQEAGGPPAAPGGEWSDISAKLRAGEVNAAEAVEMLIEAVVRQKVGEAVPAMRERLRAAIRRYLEADPVLADKIRQLDRRDEG